MSQYLVALPVVVCLSISLPATGQPFYGVVYRPSNVQYDVIRSEHFDVIYQRGLDSLAVRVAQVAEEAYPGVVREAGLRRPLHMPIVINGYNDASNGLVSPLPFRMEIDAAPIKGKILNPRHEDWIAEVVPHELAHAAQAEIRGGFGVGDFVRLFSPDLARAINLGVPRGVTEGFAVAYESRDPGLGRLNYSFTMMEARAAASSRPWTLSQVLDPPAHTRPFDRYYIGGGILFEYLTDSLRADFLTNSARFYNRWPFLGFGIAMWQSTSMPPWKLSKRFLGYTRTVLGRPVTSAAPNEQTVLTDQHGLSFRRPVWVDDQTIVAFCSGYNVDRGFYRIEALKGRRSLVLRQSITEDYFLSTNDRRDRLLFSEYRPLTLTDGSFRSRLKEIDLASGKTGEIPGSERLYAPVRLSDGSILAVEYEGQFSKIVRLDTNGVRHDVYREAGIRALELRATPSGQLVVLVNRAGEQYLIAGSVTTGVLDSIGALISPGGGSIYDPAWSPDGKEVVFSADPDGTPNVYALEIEDGSVRRLTDAAFGAFEASVSPDGRRLAFVNYVHEQYQIVVKPMDTDRTDADSLFRISGRSCGLCHRDAAPRAGRRPATTELSAPGTRNLERGTWNLEPAPRPYRAFPAFLRPRAVIPIFRAEESELSDLDQRLGPGFGLSAGGADPLRRWAYSVTGFFQENRLWGSMSVQTGRHPLRPYLTLSDRPWSTVQPVNGTLTRRAYEERSAELGAYLPARLSSGGRQSYVVAGASTELRSIRFLDSDGGPLTEFDDRVTLNPFLLLGYRLKANPRDIIPNDGMTIVSRAEVDVQTEDVAAPSRSWRSDATFYLPMFPEISTRVAARFGVLWQNGGSDLDVDTFLPRGYDEEDVFLGPGTFFKAGLEVVQPIAWVDRGIVLIPISVQAIYLYGFTETLGQPVDWMERRSSAGAGLGVRMLFGHHLGFDARIGVARLLEENEWAVTTR
ncbi:MAG TPA: hypothetical protein VMO47_08275 [Rhodothermales bacterium]|nr:hypothetical protein [Rhodothermales bacterium]